MGLLTLLTTPISALFGHASSPVFPEPEDIKIGRRYAVPKGLAPLVLELIENFDIAVEAGRGREAHYKLWRLLRKRCPEVTTGRWRLYTDNCGKPWVEEVVD